MISILDQKKLVLFPEIGQVKIFLTLTHQHSRMCIRIYIFNFKKWQTNKQKKKQESKKAKENNEEKKISLENWLNKNLQPSGWRFFSSPAFQETRLFFFYFICICFSSLFVCLFVCFGVVFCFFCLILNIMVFQIITFVTFFENTAFLLFFIKNSTDILVVY